MAFVITVRESDEIIVSARSGTNVTAAGSPPLVGFKHIEPTQPQIDQLVADGIDAFFYRLGTDTLEAIPDNRPVIQFDSTLIDVALNDPIPTLTATRISGSGTDVRLSIVRVGGHGEFIFQLSLDGAGQQMIPVPTTQPAHLRIKDGPTGRVDQDVIIRVAANDLNGIINA